MPISKIKKKDSPKTDRIKVKLDSKTTIIINRLESLAVWKKHYPLAQIVN